MPKQSEGNNHTSKIIAICFTSWGKRAMANKFEV